ncbi:MAG: hypothetical protein Q8M65_07150 [Rhodoglobus sp.]|nr:hypothetical protein [Rhodoglobus sp.]
MNREVHPEFESTLRRCMGTVPFQTYQPLPDAPLPQIVNGIVFVVALWSGPALASLTMLRDVLNAYGERPPPLFVVDTDELPPEAWKALGATPAGAGETFWIHGGHVVGRTTGCRRGVAEEMRENTARIYGQAAA